MERGGLGAFLFCYFYPSPLIPSFLLVSFTHVSISPLCPCLCSCWDATLTPPSPCSLDSKAVIATGRWSVLIRLDQRSADNGPAAPWPNPPGEPLPEQTPLTARAEGKQEVDKKKLLHSWEADFTHSFPTGLLGCGPSLTTADWFPVTQ